MSKESPATKKPVDNQGLKNQNESTTVRALLKIGGTIGLGFVIFFIGQLLPVVLLVTVLTLTGRNSEQITDLLKTNAPLQMIVSVCIALFTSFLIWRLLRWRGHKPIQFLLLRNFPKPGQIGEVVLTYGVYFVVLIISSILVGSFTAIDIEQQQELGVAATAGSALVFTFVMLVVVPPIFEEIVFRGFLYRYLFTFGGKILAYTLTSILFGIAHLEFGNLNWIAAIDTLIFSGFLIYISQKHQSLYSAMLLHAMKNGIAFYVLFVR